MTFHTGRCVAGISGFGAALLLAGSSSGAVTLTPTQDAEVKESSPLERRGAPSRTGTRWQDELAVRGNENKHVYLDYDLTGLSVADVNGMADLTFRVKANFPTGASGFRVYAFHDAQTWNETTVLYRDIFSLDDAVPYRNLTNPDNAPGILANYAQTPSPPPEYYPINDANSFDVDPTKVSLLGYLNFDATSASNPVLGAGELLSFTRSSETAGIPENSANNAALVAFLTDAIAAGDQKVTFLITAKYAGDPGGSAGGNMNMASKEFDPDGAAGSLATGAWAPQLIVGVVPEPSLLAGAALGSIALIRRRRA